MAKVNIKPLADRVLIEPMQAETKTASGIIIPDTAKEKPQKGKVVAVGPGTKDEKITVKSVGFRSLRKICWYRIKIGRKRLFNDARVSDILAIMIFGN